MNSPNPSKPPGLLQMIGSVAAAAFGVQSSANRERDFKRGKPVYFVVLGVVGTVVFLLLIWLMVRLAISTLGA